MKKNKYNMYTEQNEAASGDATMQLPTTILVPGFGDNEDSLRVLEHYLLQRVGPTLTISPQPSNGALRIEALAAILATQIEQHVRLDQAVNLVGFSMGGLICRYYIQRIGTVHRVKHLMTVATPHLGTWSAYINNCPACIQMRPGSQFLERLNSDLAALNNIHVTSMWTPFDMTIIPSMSSWLPIGEIVTIASPFHQTMLTDPRVLNALSARLMR